MIETTYNHPFWVSDKGWMHTEDMQVGDLLEKADGSTLKIEKIEVVAKHATVYNFTVAEHHTYFVSDLGIWVHNTNCFFVKDIAESERKALAAGKSSHMVSDHVGRTPQDLLNDVMSGRRPKASSFWDMNVAQNVVNNALKVNAQGIQNWLDSTSTRYFPVQYGGNDKIIGFGYGSGAANLDRDM